MSTDWSILKNLPPLRRESRCCCCCQCWPSCPLKSQVFLNIASCFQTVIWCCEHPRPVKLWYAFRLDVCMWRATGELHSERGNGVNFVYTEASSYGPRAPGAPPPSPASTKLLPHLHIRQPALCTVQILVCFVPSAHLSVEFWKAQQQNIILRVLRCQFEKLKPFRRRNGVGVCLFVKFTSELLQLSGGAGVK